LENPKKYIKVRGDNRQSLCFWIYQDRCVESSRIYRWIDAGVSAGWSIGDDMSDMMSVTGRGDSDEYFVNTLSSFSSVGGKKERFVSVCP
jgi:hypothetical protein